MGSEGTYAEVSAAMASMKLKYRSVKFKCEDKDVKDVDIVRALMVQCDVEEIERVHPMPGNYWVVSFTTEDLAEEAQNGFISKEKRIHRPDGPALCDSYCGLRATRRHSGRY